MATDAHSHIHSLADAVAVANDSGCAHIVVCGTHPADWDQVVALPPGVVLPSIGVHPLFTTELQLDAVLRQLEDRLRESPHLQLGEIGLDRSPRGLAANDWDDQLPFFEAQLLLAVRLHRSVSVHSVRAHGEVLAALRRACDATGAVPRAVLLHSWGGNITITHEFMALAKERGFPVLFSFQGDVIEPVAAAFGRWHATTGQLTTTSPPKYMRSLETLPPSSLAFETDAPDQAFCVPAPLEQWMCRVFGLAPSAPSVAPPHVPSRVVLVIAAAAMWRTLRRTHGAAGGGGGIGDAPFVDEVAARGEYDSLVAASTANVLAAFA